MQNEAETPYFSILKNLEPVEISTGNTFLSKILKFRLKNVQKHEFWGDSCRNFWGVAGKNFDWILRIDLSFHKH